MSDCTEDKISSKTGKNINENIFLSGFEIGVN